jgi:cephalosporin hydroxylase
VAHLAAQNSSVATWAFLAVSMRPTVVIISGTLGRSRLLQTFDAPAPLVTIGSYVVMENTAVNGHPILAELLGPAVAHILAVDDRFTRERSFERFAMTFNPGGYLRRVR